MPSTGYPTPKRASRYYDSAEDPGEHPHMESQSWKKVRMASCGGGVKGNTACCYIRVIYFLRQTWKTGFSESEMKTIHAKKERTRRNPVVLDWGVVLMRIDDFHYTERHNY